MDWHHVVEGLPVWAPYGTYGWSAAVVTRVGKNYKQRTWVDIAYDRGGRGRRRVDTLVARQPRLRGKDKPRPLAELAADNLFSALSGVVPWVPC